MTVVGRSKDQSVGTKRDFTVTSARLLLLVSALTVMVFTLAARGHMAVSVTGLLFAAMTAGLAILRPITVRDLDRLRRAEWTLVISLLLAGLIVTVGMLARVLAVPSPVGLALISVYVILGLLAALPAVRRLPHLRWAFPLFLLAHVAATVLFLRASPAHNDVQVFLHDGAGALLQGNNPYSMTFPYIFRSPNTELFYGPGVVVDGRVTYGFPYLPASLVLAIPGRLMGDVRYTQLVAMLTTALVLRSLASDRIGRAVAVVGVASVSALPVLAPAWTEPTLVALLACLVLALERRRHTLLALLLGLFLVSKQYVVVALPLFWVIRQWLTRRVVSLGVGLAVVMTLPFFLVDPPAFWKAIVKYQLIQPFRADSVSLLVSSVNSFGWPPPWTYGLLPLVGGGLTALALAVRAPRTPAAFAASIGLTLLVTILLSKQAFINYYFLVSGAFLIAAVAWPTGKRTGETPP